MANIEKRVIPPVPVEPSVEYVITLTEQEAKDLWDLLPMFPRSPRSIPTKDRQNQLIAKLLEDLPPYNKVD